MTKKVLLVSFFANIFLSLIKIIIGFIGKSSALISDGVHSFSDLITDVVAIFGSSLSMKPADKEHPYGHGKLEYITSFVIGLTIVLIGIILIKSISNNNLTIPSVIVIIVSLITIIIKYLVSRYLIIKGKEYKNLILISSGKESSMDVISSIFVLISSLLMQLSSKIIIFKYSDKIVSIIIGIFIIKTGISIIKESISKILDERENDKIVIEEFKKLIYSYKQIKNIDSLIILKSGPYYKITTEISMNPRITLFKAHKVAEELEDLLKEKTKALYITIHINPYHKCDIIK